MEALTAVLERDQDPRGMGELQELIGVSAISRTGISAYVNGVDGRRTCWCK